MEMREAYGRALLELGSLNDDIVSVEADVSSSVKSIYFCKQFPERSVNVGIAELHMCTMAAGLSTTGKIPFVNAFAIFIALRAPDAVSNLIAQENLNVKLIGSYSGYSSGVEGGSHQSINDIAIMRTMPNMSVIVACDNQQVRKATLYAAEHKGPVYLRVLKVSVPDVYNEAYKFQFGKGNQLKNGNDVTIIATGSMVYYGLKAAAELEKEGISARVIDMHTIKPLDEAIIIKAAKETCGIVTAEEHSVLGGLGSAVAEVVSKKRPVPIEMVGVEDFFGSSGSYIDLLNIAGLNTENIIRKAKRIIARKAEGDFSGR